MSAVQLIHSMLTWGSVYRAALHRIGRKNWKNTGRNYWVEMRVPPKRRRKRKRKRRNLIGCLHLPLLHQALILPAVHLIQKMRTKSKGRKKGKRNTAPHGNLQQAQLPNQSQTARTAQKRKGQRKIMKERRKEKITTGKGRRPVVVMDLCHQNPYQNRIRQRRCKQKRRKTMRKKRKQQDKTKKRKKHKKHGKKKKKKIAGSNSDSE
ncbi:protein FAM133B isoform X3 [Rissa tridactyla]|uniref:protein FAM133B isoform X3 n=1 Tax=Rissa tridactyla TaxID=75485 RepID=UPI0023BACD33|nr:protein FAM133B isoform X3 [Rissa tridactyla]